MQQELRTAYLALGANIGDPRETMRAAVRAIRESAACEVGAVSSLYRTKPVGITEQPDFLNAAIAIRTSLEPRELLTLCAGIENTLGRRRTIRWGPRVIDIDILIYDDLNMRDADIELPHPRMLERAFVMVPLAEIAPDTEVEPGLTAGAAAQSLERSGVELVEGSSWCD